MSSDVLVKFGADTTNLKDGIDKSRAAVQSFGQTIEGLSGSTKKAGDDQDSFTSKVVSGFEKITLGVAAAVAAISGALVGIGAQASSFGESIRTAAGAFDQSFASIAGVKAVADRSGLGLTDLGKSFSDLQKKAREGDDDVTAALKAIGVSTHEAATLSQDALAVRMAQAFSTAKDSANKAQAAVTLFGAATAEKLVPQLDRGADSIRDIQAAADRAGVVIGPELSASLRGTTGLFAQFGDRIAEVKEAMQGKLLQSFVQFKPAIDGLVQLFSDVVKNVASVIEWFNDLDGAGRRSGQAIGVLGQAAQAFSRGMVEAATYVEEFAVRSVQRIENVGLSFNGLANVADALGRDIANMSTASSTALYTAFREAIAGVIAAFGDLAEAGKRALSFDFSGVAAAFAKLGADAGAVGDKIKAALSPQLLTNTNKAWSDMQAGAAASAKSLDAVIAKLEAQKKAQLDLIAAGGAKGGPVPQTRSVGNPAAPDDDDARNSQKLQAAITEAEGEVQALRDAEQQKETLLNAGVSLHQLSEDQKIAATKASLSDQLEATTAIYQKLINLEGLTAAQRAEIQNKMEAAIGRYNEKVLQLNIQAAQETQKTWDAATSSISGAINSQVDGIIAGTTRLRDAFRNVLASMLGDAIKFCITWATRHAATIAENILGVNAGVAAQISGEAAKTTAVQAGEATKTSAVAAGAAARVTTEIGAAAASVATTIGSVLKSIAAFAAQAFAGVTAFLSGILGPAALGVAGGVEAAVIAVGSSLPAFAAGTMNVPQDMVAQVHAGEMIIPSAQAAAIRSALGPGATFGNWQLPSLLGMASPARAPSQGGPAFAARAIEGLIGGGGDTHNHHYNTVMNVTATAVSGDQVIRALDTKHRELAKRHAHSFHDHIAGYRTRRP